MFSIPDVVEFVVVLYTTEAPGPSVLGRDGGPAVLGRGHVADVPVPGRPVDRLAALPRHPHTPPVGRHATPRSSIHRQQQQQPPHQ